MKQRRKFSKDFKLKAIEMSNNSDYIKDVAIELGIREALLYRWRREYEKKAESAFNGEGKSFSKSEESKELAQLRKENKALRIERDILKKAVGIFSKND